jgi:integrase
MSCLQVPAAPAFNPYPRLVQVGEFEVATGGGIWVAIRATAYGTHTMRRTKASLIYRRTKNIRAVQLLLGHTKLESTVRYLGIEVEDALELSEQTEI